MPAGGSPGSTVEVRAVGSFSNWPPVIEQSEAAPLQITPGDEKGALTVLIPEDSPVGRVWLRIVDHEGISEARPFVVDHAPSVAEQEPNDTLAKAQPLGDATVADGVLAKSGDVDTYQLDLDADAVGRTLVLSLAAHETLGSPMDGIVQLVGADGFVLGANDDEYGFDSLLTFPIERPGCYHARVFAFPADPNSSIRYAGGSDYVYRLTASVGPVLDYALPLAVRQGTTQRIEPSGWNLPPEIAAEVEASSPLRALCFGRPGMSGRATLSVVDMPVAVQAQAAAEPVKLAVPVCVTGRLVTPGVPHEYALELMKGTPLRARVEARELGFPTDPVAQLFDKDGKSIARSDDLGRFERDAVLDATIPADGTYRLVVKDLHGFGGPRFAYRLTVTDGPDFRVSAASDRFSVEAGKSVDVKVTLDRWGGRNEPIVVKAIGLPDGFEAPAVESPGKGKEAKEVTLKVTPAKDAKGHWSFGIVAHPKDADQDVRTADAHVPAGRTTRFWLVVPGKK